MTSLRGSLTIASDDSRRKPCVDTECSSPSVCWLRLPAVAVPIHLRKAAGDSPPITLTARATTGPGAPGGDQLAEFARQVAELSSGEVTINVVDPLDGGASSEAPTVQTVQSGEVDIGFVPARIFDTLVSPACALCRCHS